MPAHKAHISLRFGGGSLEIDGVDLSHAVQHAELSFDANGDRIPRLILDLAVLEVDADAEAVGYELTLETEKALAVLGWTPPTA